MIERLSKREHVELVFKCRKVFQHAIYHKKIIRQRYCEICGSDRHVIGHHHDYRLPLDVQWLCKTCHALYHQIHGNSRSYGLPRATKDILGEYVKWKIDRAIRKNV